MPKNQNTDVDADIRRVEKQLELFHLIFDSIYNGAMVTDAKGIVVHRIPIKKEKRLIAVLGLVMFQDVGDVVNLAKKLRHLESQVKRYKKELMTRRSTRCTLDSIIGNSRATAELKQEALVAAANTSRC